jgi:uncharacterized membrane protein
MEAEELVNINSNRTLFFVIALVLALVVASPTIAMFMPPLSNSEKLSELWLLDSNHATEDFPFNASAGDMYSVFVGVANRMGSSEDYKVYVKFRNINQSAPDSKNGVASSLSPLMEYPFSVEADEIWESPVNFGFDAITEDFGNTTAVNDNVLSVNEVIVDGVTFPLNVSTTWDSERKGYFFQLFFELWRYDDEYADFRFDSLSVGLWLNVTNSSLVEVL